MGGKDMSEELFSSPVAKTITTKIQKLSSLGIIKFHLSEITEKFNEWLIEPEHLNTFIDDIIDLLDSHRRKLPDISEYNPQQEIYIPENQITVEEFIERERIKL